MAVLGAVLVSCHPEWQVQQHHSCHGRRVDYHRVAWWQWHQVVRCVGVLRGSWTKKWSVRKGGTVISMRIVLMETKAEEVNEAISSVVSQFYTI